MNLKKEEDELEMKNYLQETKGKNPISAAVKLENYEGLTPAQRAVCQMLQRESGDPPFQTREIQQPGLIAEVNKTKAKRWRLKEKRGKVLYPVHNDQGELSVEAAAKNDDIWAKAFLKEESSSLALPVLFDTGNTSRYPAISYKVYKDWEKKINKKIPLEQYPNKIASAGGGTVS